MAEPTGDYAALDSRLRDALGQAANPGDPTGVADAIRARVAAGDPGTSVAGSRAPGWGGGIGSWLPWLGLVLVGGLVGGGLGVSGAVGRPTGDTVVDVTVVLAESAPAYSCVDGPRIGRLGAGTRVLAVQRSDDAGWVGVRDPGALSSTVWVELGDVSLDAGVPALDALPIGGTCPQTVVVTPTPEPEPEPPAPPADTTSPVITQAGVTAPFYSINGQTTTVSATATDDRGVVRVAVTVIRPDGATVDGELQNSGGTWSYVYDPKPDNLGGLYRFVLTAFDAAGNSASTEVSVQGT